LKFVLPIVLYDHDGFNSGIDDGEPSRVWSVEIDASDEWLEIIRVGGPPLYGVPVRRVG
jgi:hypothetical protein